MRIAAIKGLLDALAKGVALPAVAVASAASVLREEDRGE